MGPDQLSAVMHAVGKGGGGGGGSSSSSSNGSPKPNSDPQVLRARIEHESEVTFGSARLWDDGVIPPARTRAVLGAGLRTALGGAAAAGAVARDDGFQRGRESTFGIFRM